MRQSARDFVIHMGSLNLLIFIQIVGTLFSGLLLGATMADATTLSVRILDESGHSVPAHIYLKNQHGESFSPSATLVYRKFNWNVAEEHFIVHEGALSIGLPKGNYYFRVERGKEYLPIQDNITVPESGRLEKTDRLKRWTSMNDLGWYSADMHAHVSLKNAAALMDGEDLNVLFPITL